MAGEGRRALHVSSLEVLGHLHVSNDKARDLLRNSCSMR